MSILRDLINKIKTNDFAEQMRILCDQILIEQTEKMCYIEQRPQGANIFVCLQVPGLTTRDVGFLALEREDEDLWLASFWNIKETELLKVIALEHYEHRPRKKKVHQIQDHRPEKVLTEYAKLFKFYNGE